MPISEHYATQNPDQVPGQVLTKNWLKEVKQQKYKSVSILSPII